MAFAHSLTPNELKAEILAVLGLAPSVGFAQLEERLARQARALESLCEQIIGQVPHLRLSPNTSQRKARIARDCGKLKNLRLRAAQALEKLETLTDDSPHPTGQEKTGV